MPLCPSTYTSTCAPRISPPFIACRDVHCANTVVHAAQLIPSAMSYILPTSYRVRAPSPRRPDQAACSRGGAASSPAKDIDTDTVPQDVYMSSPTGTVSISSPFDVRRPTSNVRRCIKINAPQVYSPIQSSACYTLYVVCIMHLSSVVLILMH